MKKCVLVCIVITALMLCFCDKGDPNDIRILFPGPGFEKGWSWINMPAEFSPLQLEQYSEENNIKFIDIEKAASVVFFFGDAGDSAFTVVLYKMKTDSLAKWYAGSIKQDGHTRLFAEGGYVVAIETEHTAEHIHAGMDTVAAKMMKKIILSANIRENTE